MKPNYIFSVLLLVNVFLNIMRGFKMIKNLLSVVMGVVLTFSFAFNAYANEQNMKEVKIKTSAFSFMCKNKIESVLKDKAGVDDTYLDLNDKVVTIKFDDKKLKAEDLEKEIKSMGYEAEIMKDYTQSEKKNDTTLKR
jgi:copper chaperone CopZ